MIIVMFFIFAQNIVRGYTLEPVTTIYVLEQKLEKSIYPTKTQFYYIKMGFKGVKLTRTCYPDEYFVRRLKKSYPH